MLVCVCLKIYAEGCLNYVNGLTASEEMQYSNHMQAFFQTHAYLLLKGKSTSIKHKENLFCPLTVIANMTQTSSISLKLNLKPKNQSFVVIKRVHGTLT